MGRKGVDSASGIFRWGFLFHILLLAVMVLSFPLSYTFEAGLRLLAGAAVDVLVVGEIVLLIAHR